MDLIGDILPQLESMQWITLQKNIAPKVNGIYVLRNLVLVRPNDYPNYVGSTVRRKGGLYSRLNDYCTGKRIKGRRGLEFEDMTCRFLDLPDASITEIRDWEQELIRHYQTKCGDGTDNTKWNFSGIGNTDYHIGENCYWEQWFPRLDSKDWCNLLYETNVIW